jgi:hypothetical protein
MNKVMAGVIAVGMLALVAAPALASETATARDIQAAVDSYVSSARTDASLVGGPGSAGYDAGFWIRGGDFSLRINATLQARYEAVMFDPEEPGENFGDRFGGGGSRSGFSLPRATLKLSGTAPCSTRYYIELEFGHPGEFARELQPGFFGNIGPDAQTFNYSNTREAWIEWGCSPALNFRMGQIKIPTTRQLMTPPELQQFVDISLHSSFIGTILPGYTDRNREHGAMFHGAFGCENEFQWMFAVTNGDSGDSIRNILDGRTDDNVAFSGRLNWAFLGATGYEEGALRQNSCTWYGELGAWGFYHAERTDRPHTVLADVLVFGGDLQLGYGGFSMTGAFTMGTFEPGVGADTDVLGWLVQAGYLFPDTAWEIAARWSSVAVDDGVNDGALTEFAGAINYYLNGHGNKFTLDVSYITPGDPLGGNLANLVDLYPGYPGFFQPGGIDNDVLLIRFQWQLAL